MTPILPSLLTYHQNKTRAKDQIDQEWSYSFLCQNMRLSAPVPSINVRKKKLSQGKCPKMEDAPSVNTHQEQICLSRGTILSIPSVAANKEPRPKGPLCLSQVSRLAKSLVPRDHSAYPKCRG